MSDLLPNLAPDLATFLNPNLEVALDSIKDDPTMNWPPATGPASVRTSMAHPRYSFNTRLDWPVGLNGQPATICANSLSTPDFLAINCSTMSEGPAMPLPPKSQADPTGSSLTPADLPEALLTDALLSMNPTDRDSGNSSGSSGSGGLSSARSDPDLQADLNPNFSPDLKPASSTNPSFSAPSSSASHHNASSLSAADLSATDEALLAAAQAQADTNLLSSEELQTAAQHADGFAFELEDFVVSLNDWADLMNATKAETSPAPATTSPVTSAAITPTNTSTLTPALASGQAQPPAAAPAVTAGPSRRSSHGKQMPLPKAAAPPSTTRRHTQPGSGVNLTEPSAAPSISLNQSLPPSEPGWHRAADLQSSDSCLSDSDTEGAPGAGSAHAARSPQRKRPAHSTHTTGTDETRPKAARRPKSRHCTKRFASSSIDTLKEWLFAHTDRPYPTDQDKTELMQQTGLDLMQINNWFINARRRLLVKVNKPSRNKTSTSRPSSPTAFCIEIDFARVRLRLHNAVTFCDQLSRF
ncbi:uncharacterized protein MONBRDRAFT_27982 [Monosiga brevicollis MX1]|uniref:Homeobox domain-containing protein n=1 Tax=Monosiga brevicollis TaxID=81824 RepID=A9V6V5_MONBE|nr:uncharacterized protein MONBRDRAFT_27982 [Monosiga brevicollis MX1]EDQ86610.1 predicted protein [Monosiga brevicollis MX1]|eukprot:XP_001748446.1 hypothetical protein [Monosiga brevicollis MX1]